MPLPDLLKSSAVFGVALLLGMVVLSPVAEACRRSGFCDPPGAHKTHRAPVPLGGFLFVLPLWWELVRAGHREWFLGAGAVLAIGLWEDLRKARGRELPWPFRLGVITAAVVGAAWASGADLASPAAIEGMAVVWCATHAFNWFDHADGYAAGAGLGALLGLALAGRPELAAALGVLAAFWLANGVRGRRAAIYLGDAGAQSLGFCVAALAGLPAVAEGGLSPWPAFAAAAIPILDALRVCAVRMVKRRAIWKPDREHHLGHLPFSRALPRGWMPVAIVAAAGVTTYLVAR